MYHGMCVCVIFRVESSVVFVYFRSEGRMVCVKEVKKQAKHEFLECVFVCLLLCVSFVCTFNSDLD